MKHFRRLDEIHALIDRLEEAVHSPENERRKNFGLPTAWFYPETPIAEAKLFGYDANQLFTDPEFYVEQKLREMIWRWENFPEDDLPLAMEIPAWLSHYPEYTFVGLNVQFDREGVPLFSNDHPLSKDADLRHLKPVDFYTSGWMPRILRWYEDLRAIVRDRMKVTFNMIWWRGCLDLAVEMRGYDNFIADTVERPQFLHDLLKFLTEQRCRWWDAYYRHYDLPVTPTDIGDDWINIPFISPAIFADFVLPRYFELEAFHGGIHHIHTCGNQVPVLRYFLQIKSQRLYNINAWTDLEKSLAILPPEMDLIIGLHPNDVLVADDDQIKQKFHKITTLCQGRKYQIMTSGLTPISSSPEDYIRSIRNWNRVARQILEPIRNK